MRLTGTDLDEWARRRVAEGELPELVRRLIQATVADRDLLRLEMPADEGIAKRDADGRVETVVGNTYVPGGASVWEVGRNEDYKKKAQHDYVVRTKQRPPPGVDLAQSTFVFVTPRRWHDRGDWELKWREERAWKDVRIHDADALAAWLQLAPSVGVWLAELLGRPGPLHSLEYCWREWSLAAEPPISEGLVLAGREREREHLQTWLSRPSSALPVHAADAGEAAAFCWATLQQMPHAEREAWLARTVVVSGADELRRLALEPRPLLLIARSCPIELARLAAASGDQRSGHHVLLASSSRVGRDTLVLGQLDPPQAQAELERMGLREERARKLILAVRGALPGGSGVSLAAVRSYLGDLDGDLHEELAPLVLVGAWTDDHEDVQAVCRILGDSPERLHNLQRHYSGQYNSPLVCEGDRWRWVSRRDAWRQLGQCILANDLVAFEEVFAELFAPDGIRGSSEIRRGLLEGLMLLTVGPDSRQSTHDAQLPERIVARLLGSRATVEQWSNLGGVLPLLAEAAPELFLEHAMRVIPAGLDGEVPRELIVALEVLAWREDFLPTVTELLARIATATESREGAGLAMNSLHGIFRPWQPQTTASLECRCARLEELAKRHPRVAVELMLKLLPSSFDGFSATTRRPRYRDWAESADDEISPEDIHAAFVHSWGLLLDLMGKDARHWLVILPKLDRLSHDHLSAAVDMLAQLDESQLGTAERESLRRQLRSLIHHDRRYSHGQWSLPESQLTRLEATYERLAPPDLRDSLAWLFETGPAALLHPPTVHECIYKFHQALNGERQLAARQLAAEFSASQLVDFVYHVGDPAVLGYALGAIDREGLVLDLLHASAASTHAGIRAFRCGLGQALAEHGFDPATITLPAPCQADILLGYPKTAATWDLAESAGSEVAEQYWRQISELYPREPHELERVVRSLLSVGRAWVAAEVAASARVMKVASLEDALIAELLEAASQTRPEEPEQRRHPWNLDIQELFDQLRESGPPYHDDLRRLEWALLSTFDFRRHHPRVIYEALASEPQYFVSMMKLAYSRKSIGDKEQSDAAHARNLLHHWNLLPGQLPDGSVDLARLRSWLRTVRVERCDLGPAATLDRWLGEVLGNSPEGTDGRWPHEALREALEDIQGTDDFETGLYYGRRQHLGLQVRWVEPGLDQAHANKLREDAQFMRTRWPSAARVLDKLARSAEGDARMWSAFVGRDQDWTPPATTVNRVEAFLRALQKQGQYIFSYDQLVQAVGDRADLMHVLTETTSVAALSADAYVVVRPEYHDVGGPPPSWFIHELMTRQNVRYCVGLLSAAALHGAAPQQPQIFQVLVDEPRERAKIGAHVIEFFTRGRAQEFITQQINTYTGFMHVATPEATVFDLVEFADLCGGRDAIVGVLEDLGDDLDRGALRAVAGTYPSPIVMSAAEMLDEAGHGQLALSLRQPSPQRILGTR